MHTVRLAALLDAIARPAARGQFDLESTEPIEVESVLIFAQS